MRRRELLSAAGVGATVGLAGCQFGRTSGHQPGADLPLWDREITVGVLAPKNETLPVGNAIANGARLAAERINADGGIAGASLELKVVDTEFTPSTAAAEHRRLCEDVGCDLTVGLFVGSAVLESLPSISEQETVHLTTGSLDGRPGEHVAEEYDAFRYHFRPGVPNYHYLGAAIAEFAANNAADFGWERSAVLTENIGELTPFHDALADGVSDHLDVRFAERPSWVNAPLMDYIEEEGCDVALSGFALGGTTAVNMWAQQERDFALGGLHLPAMVPGYWETTEGNVESVFTVGGLTDGAHNTGRTQQFVADYRRRFGRPPAYTGATTYDALRIYRQAVERLVGYEDSDLPEQDAIVESLESVTFTDGVVYPRFEFTGAGADRVHEPVWESMRTDGVPIVQQWQTDAEGEPAIESIAPGRHRTASYQAPPWLAEE